ncbi:MAG: YbhB/YbcL family Raf kinase inhibitor-like protein [Polyangiales bacterium]
MRLTLTSSAFANGASIPARHTCEGDDVSPPLGWSTGPSGTQSFALIVDDPDAPDPRAPKGTWTHWVVHSIPVDARALVENTRENGLPLGAREGLNDWRRVGYSGPCPPVGRHRYVHTLYALDTTLTDLGQPTRAQLLAAMVGHVLAQAELVGTYEKHGK